VVKGEVRNGPEQASEALVKSVTTVMGSSIRGSYYTLRDPLAV